MSVKVDTGRRTFEAETNVTSTDLRAAYMNFKEKTATRERRNRGIRTVAKTMAMTMGAVALAATLAACSAPADNPTPPQESAVSSIGSGSAQVVSRIEIGGQSSTTEYIEQIDIITTRPGGSQVKVSCISTKDHMQAGGLSGGITCDWANAVPVK